MVPPVPSAHPSGPARPPVATVIDELCAQFDRYRAGELDARTMARLVDRTGRRLRTACFCTSGDCCAVHETHVSPHTGCVLR